MKDGFLLRRILGSAYLIIVMGFSIYTWTRPEFTEVAHLMPPPAGEGFSFAWNPLGSASKACNSGLQNKHKFKQVCNFTQSPAQKTKKEEI